MKNIILILAVIVFIAATTLNSCKSSAKKAENAGNKIQQISITEYQKFKKESEERIITHEKSIAEFKARIAKEKKQNRDRYEKKLALLEQKNIDMKKKLDDYKEAGRDEWLAFKNDFDHDMDEIGKALKNFYYQ